MNRLLLIEDDPGLGYILKEYLQMCDFNIEWAKDGEEGLKLFKRGSYDLCILDIMMPKKDGFAVAEELKKHNPSMPLIFLTAKSMKIDKLKGFKIGADDYIVKPVDEEELIARIQAVLRRVGSLREEKRSHYQIGKYAFNSRNQLLTINKEERHLTQKESKVLEMLCKEMGQLVDRDSMLRTLWGESDYFKRRSMDVFISKLRKHLSEDPCIKINNIHGKGYILEVR
ncbi:MAG: response regulator transcription factor [Ekhidna sp.]